MTDPSRRTRGKSRPGRLRLLDAWLFDQERGLLTRRDGAYADAPTVDLGFGAVPWTTRELTVRLRELAPDAQVIGADIDPSRVASAQREETPGLRFITSGFDLPGPPARLVRAMNVLRQYNPDDIPAAHDALRRALLPGGLAIEGSTSKGGETLVAHLLRSSSPDSSDSLLFATDFSAGFAPRMFARCLPRDLRPAGRPVPAVARFLDAWTAAWAPHSASPEAFALSAVPLPDVCVGRVGEVGWVVWTPQPPRSVCAREAVRRE